MHISKPMFAIAALSALASLASCAPNPPMYAIGAQGASPVAGIGVRTITVSGESEVMVAPDEVVISLGVTNLGMNIPATKAKNDEVVKRLIKIAADHGVASEKVRTDYVSIQPEYAYRDGEQVFKGYRVRQDLAITLGDVSKYEALVQALLEAGVNAMDGIAFRTTELRKHRDEARALAIKAAREKAEALAKELGQSIGAPLTIVENSVGSDISSPNALAQNVVMYRAAAMETGGGGSLAPGQIDVAASVTVSFELR